MQLVRESLLVTKTALNAEELAMVLFYGKLISLALSGLLAIVSVLLNLRRPDGKLTVWGKFFLCGAIGFAALTVGIFLKEDSDAKATARANAERGDRVLASISETTERTQRVLGEVLRSREQVSLKDLQFHISWTISIDDPAFDSYRKRLAGEFEVMRQEYAGQYIFYREIAEHHAKVHLDPDRRHGIPDFIALYPGSDLLPDFNREEERNAARIVGLYVGGITFTNPDYPDEGIEVLLSGALLDEVAGDGIPLRHGSVTYYPGRGTLIVTYAALPDCGIAAPSKAFLGVVDYEKSTAQVDWVLPKALADQIPSVRLNDLRVLFGPDRRVLPSKTIGPVECLDESYGLICSVTFGD